MFFVSLLLWLNLWRKGVTFDFLHGSLEINVIGLVTSHKKYGYSGPITYFVISL